MSKPLKEAVEQLGKSPKYLVRAVVHDGYRRLPAGYKEVEFTAKNQEEIREELVEKEARYAVVYTLEQVSMYREADIQNMRKTAENTKELAELERLKEKHEGGNK